MTNSSLYAVFKFDPENMYRPEHAQSKPYKRKSAAQKAADKLNESAETCPEGGFVVREYRPRRIDAERDERLAAWERWRDQAHDKEFDARVTAWDFVRGEGLVYVPEFNATFEVFACNLPGRKTWYPETACAFYEVGETVRIRFDVSFARTTVIGVTQAYIDNEKWDSLDQSRLAFKCDESGQPVNGLFV